MLKLFYEKAEDVPEALKAYYTEREGKFHLQVEGVKTQADIDRVTTSLKNERTAHDKTKADLVTAKADLGKFEGLNPDEVHTKLGEYETLKATAGNTPDAKKIEEIVSARVESVIKSKTTPMQREIDTLKAAKGELEKGNTELKGTLTQRTIDDAVRNVALAEKANPQAINDFLHLARNDLVIAEDGTTVTTKDGLDLKTFVTDQKTSRPWLWPSAQGANANGSGGPAGPGGKNPWSREHWNVTEQGKAITADRAAAEKMAVAAGTTVAAGAPAPAKPAAAA